MRRAIGGLVLWMSVLGAAFAQADERAASLLGGLERASQEVETFDYTLLHTIFSPQTSKVVENRMRFAVDVGRRYLYGESTFGGTANSRFVYRDGEAVASDLRANETFTPPREITALFERWLEQAAAPDISEHDLKRASYDGVQAFGEIVRGEQVRVVATLPDYLGTSLGKGPVKLLFDEAGRHLASVYTVTAEAGKEEVLAVYLDPDDPMLLSRYLNADLYELEHGRIVPVGETRLERLAINEPLDEALFELEAVSERR